MKKVIVNVDFKDRETGKMRKAGKTIEISEERVAEIKEVNPNFITVLGTVAEKKDDKEPAKTNDDKEPAKTNDGKEPEKIK